MKIRQKCLNKAKSYKSILSTTIERIKNECEEEYYQKNMFENKVKKRMSINKDQQINIEDTNKIQDSELQHINQKQSNNIFIIYFYIYSINKVWMPI